MTPPKECAFANLKFVQDTLVEALAANIASTPSIEYHMNESIECIKSVVAYLQQSETDEQGPGK